VALAWRLLSFQRSSVHDQHLDHHQQHSARPNPGNNIL